MKNKQHQYYSVSVLTSIKTIGSTFCVCLYVSYCLKSTITEDLNIGVLCCCCRCLKQFCLNNWLRQWYCIAYNSINTLCGEWTSHFSRKDVSELQIERHALALDCIFRIVCDIDSNGWKLYLVMQALIQSQNVARHTRITGHKHLSANREKMPVWLAVSEWATEWKLRFPGAIRNSIQSMHTAHATPIRLTKCVWTERIVYFFCYYLRQHMPASINCNLYGKLTTMSTTLSSIQ